MCDTVTFKYVMPDGVVGTRFQTKDLGCRSMYYEISSTGSLLRVEKEGEKRDIQF